MKKQLAQALARRKILILGILGLILIIAIIGLVIYFWQSPAKFAQEQAANYRLYWPQESEISKLRRNEKDYIYYYAADSKRYVFPDMSVFKSWFGDYPLDKIMFASIDAMSQSALGGNVTVRPGSLLQSPTLLNTFIVVKNGLIRPISDEKLLTQFFGDNWKNSVYVLPDYYFSGYVIAKPVKSADDWPEIPKEITINQDKDLAK